MQNAITRQVSRSSIEMIGRITTLAVEITNKGRYHVFVNWSGHVQELYGYVHRADADYRHGADRKHVFEFGIYAETATPDHWNEVLEGLEALR